MTPLESGLAAINRSLSGADDGQLLIGAKMRGLLRGYDARWIDSPYIIDTVEEMVTSDLWNPETGRKSRSFQIAGKLDVKAWHGDRRVIIDHKTTSDDIQDPASPYWRQLVVEAQPSHYALLEWMNARKVDDIVWDVMKKPAIRPAAVTKKDQAEVASSRQYFGEYPSEEALAYLRETGRENLELYEARLAYDCTTVRPQYYFQRKSVPRLDADILAHAKFVWDNGQEILQARSSGRHCKNHKACLYQRNPCNFLGICSGYDTPDSDNWECKKQVHNELPITEGDGRDVLTNSRIGTFLLCRQKHFFQYELGIERQEAEEAEALYTGSLWHAGLEAYFLALKKEQQNDGRSNCDSTLNEGVTAAINETPVSL